MLRIPIYIDLKRKSLEFTYFSEIFPFLNFLYFLRANAHAPPRFPPLQIDMLLHPLNPLG